MSAQFSAYEYTKAITNAVAAHDVDAAYSLLLLMAVHHPIEADEIREVMLLGLTMAARQDAEVTQ